MYGIYLSLFWAQCTVNFLKPHRFSVILLLLFPTRHIEQIFRLPPPIFGLLLVTIGKQRVCVVLHVPHVSLLLQQVFTGGNKAVTAALSGHHSPIHECQIQIPTVWHPHFIWFSHIPTWDKGNFHPLSSPYPSESLAGVVFIAGAGTRTVEQCFTTSFPLSCSTFSLATLVLQLLPARTVLVPAQFKWNISLRDQQWAHGNDNDHEVCITLFALGRVQRPQAQSWLCKSLWMPWDRPCASPRLWCLLLEVEMLQ